MIDDAAKNTHLSKRATRLLKYYAGCLNEFRPALAEIQKHTGIAKNKISEIRKELVDRAVICYKPMNTISINWKTIRILAGLPEPLFEEPAGNRKTLKTKRYRFNPAEDMKLLKPKIKMGKLMSRYYFRKKPERIVQSEVDFFHGIEQMTMEDYRLFSIGVLGKEPPEWDERIDYQSCITMNKCCMNMGYTEEEAQRLIWRGGQYVPPPF